MLNRACVCVVAWLVDMLVEACLFVRDMIDLSRL